MAAASGWMVAMGVSSARRSASGDQPLMWLPLTVNQKSMRSMVCFSWSLARMMLTATGSSALSGLAGIRSVSP